ncbi:hypothetical protein BpHYR1_051729 [Brachionus plicatilis]|uniref:Uncharacterized protein n=1 Tax=Brachionus plicatilis TaxID=10195 RepID=A0A3M7QH79_BRAPC|nr:hypothetical protein BpHYR1_051729 [Brachionus plicatilis]
MIWNELKDSLRKLRIKNEQEAIMAIIDFQKSLGYEKCQSYRPIGHLKKVIKKIHRLYSNNKSTACIPYHLSHVNPTLLINPCIYPVSLKPVQFTVQNRYLPKTTLVVAIGGLVIIGLFVVVLGVVLIVVGLYALGFPYKN